MEGKQVVTRSFRGEFNQKVDGKGRMSIPSDFRDVLADGDPKCPQNPLPRMVVLYGPHLKNRHLQVFTVSEMERLEDGIRQMPRGANRNRISRILLGHSWDAEIDREGRVVLPQRLRKQINLEDEAKMVAMGDHFEVWSSRTYADEEEETNEWIRKRQEQDEEYDPFVEVYNVNGE